MGLLTETNMKYLNNGKIYKIVCNITGKVYYGSTIFTLEKRLRQHEIDYTYCLKGKGKRSVNRSTSYEIIKNGNYNIYLVEDYGCLNKKQLEKIEGIYIKYNDCVNRSVVGRTKKEYYKDNKKNKLDYQREYSKKNKKNIKKYMKEYAKKKYECDCGSITTLCNLSKHKKTKKHLKHIENK